MLRSVVVSIARGRLAGAFAGAAFAGLGCSPVADQVGGPVAGASQEGCQPFQFSPELARKFGPNDSVAARISCTREAGSEMAFSYSLEATEWAGCTVMDWADLTDFDPDHGNSGVLEVTLCSTEGAPGPLNLWYGRHPHRRALAFWEDTVPLVGCVKRRFAPGDACFRDWPELPSGCRGRCGKAAVDCGLKAESSEITLAVEPSSHPQRADLRLVALRYYPSACTCRTSQSCAAREPTSTDPGATERSSCDASVLSAGERLPSPLCLADEPRCAGLCVPRGTESCAEAVGRYPDGLHRESRSFNDAYLFVTPRIGCPGPGGDSHAAGYSPFVQRLKGIQLQVFHQPQPEYWWPGGGAGDSALVFSPKQGRAYLLAGDFWQVYQCLRDLHEGEGSVAGLAAVGGLAAAGGLTLLGAPLGDVFEEDAVLKKDAVLETPQTPQTPQNLENQAQLDSGATQDQGQPSGKGGGAVQEFEWGKISTDGRGAWEVQMARPEAAAIWADCLSGTQPVIQALERPASLN